MVEKINFLLVILVMILTSFSQIRSETCTFKRTPDTTGLGDGTYIDVLDLDACEEACRVDSSCVAIYQQDPVCYFALDERTSPSTGTTHSLKVCTPDTTYESSVTTVPTTQDTYTDKPTSELTTPEPTTPEQTTPKPTIPETTTSEPTTPKPTTSEPTTPEPTTSEPTTPEPTTPEPTTPKPTTSGTNTGGSESEICIMRRKEDKTGGNNVYYKLEFSPTSCLELCRLVDDCQSVTIDGNSCRFHTDIPTTATLEDSSHYVKTQCNDGRKCCWETQTHSKSDETPAFIYNNTLDTCEALCGKFLRCSGVKWSDNKCYIYVNNPALTPESNSVFSEKICSTGGDAGNLTFSSICSERNGGIRLTTYFLYYFSVSLFSFFKHILR